MGRYAPPNEEPCRSLCTLPRNGDSARECHETENRHGKGWVAEEALGIALFCALRHQDDVAAALRAAANISGDSDSTASITGAILGATLGDMAIPARWVAAVQNRELLVDSADRLGEPAAAAGDA